MTLIKPGHADEHADEKALTTQQKQLREEDWKRTRELADRARADNTKRAYRADWIAFCEWCKSRGHRPFPASDQVVAKYVGWMADRYKPTSIRRKLSAINQIHSIHGAEKPAKPSEGKVQAVYSGMMREKARNGETAKDKVAPLLASDLRLIIDHLPRDEESGQLTLRAKRDRAILLVGFAGALRRSEIAHLKRSDVQFVPEGLRLVVRYSKTDQEGEGLTKGIFFGGAPETCPVRALRDWLHSADITTGPLFRKIGRWGHVRDREMAGYSIARIIKKRARAAGLNPNEYSGHSLRSGFITQAARNEVAERKIMNHSGHQDIRTVREYIQDATLFGDDSAARNIGL